MFIKRTGDQKESSCRETDLLGLALIGNVLNGLYPYAQDWNPLGLREGGAPSVLGHTSLWPGYLK